MPYLAVILDCFSEAARSRVLWVLMAAWTILLVAIAPFSIIQGVTTEFQADQILARTPLIDALTNASSGKGSKSQQAVWEFMEPDLKQQIIDRNKNNRGGRLPMGELSKGLSSVLDKPKLYSSDAWPTASKRSELDGLLEEAPEKLPTEKLQRLNRRLVELAFPGMIRSGESNAIWVGYAGIKVSDPLPISKKQLQPFIEGFLLVTIMRVGLGLVGVFIGIVVTSAMIPDMFQAGSLHLLLSKPVSRAGLLIAKFVGATAFIAWNVSFILVGFYLLVGWRLELWNPGILLCIPVFVFIFMIFYSVSMLSGLIWKNAIISIAITALFWGFCTVIGITHDVMSGIVTQWPKIVAIETVGDKVFSVTARGRLQLWDPDSNLWQTAYGETTGEETIIGPFWIKPDSALYFGRPYRIPFGGIQSDSIRLQIAKLPELQQNERVSSTQAEASVSANAPPLWSDQRIDSGPEFPPRTRRVIKWNDTLLALTERGLFRLDREAASMDDGRPQVSLFGFAFPTSKPSETYPSMTPSDWQPQSPMDLTPSFDQENFFVYTRGNLVTLRTIGSNQFEPVSSLDLELPEGTLALIAANDQMVLVATNKNGIIKVPIEDPKSLKLGAPVAIEGLESVVPRKVIMSSIDQSFVVLDRDGKIWSIDATGEKWTPPRLPVSDRISAIHIDATGNWWIAWGVNQITVWNPVDKQVVQSITPTLSLVDTIFHRIVSPLYWVNPKPAAVGTTIRSCITDEDPFSLGRETSELQESIIQPVDFWEPIWSNALFIGVMLVIGCSLLYRQDL